MEERPSSKAEAIEQEILRRIAASGIRLRFDKVALRLLEGMEAAIAQTLPADQSIAFTVTAPIRLPAKTSTALQEWLRRMHTGKLSTTLNGNKIRARLINKTSHDVPKVIGFVHNVDSNAVLALKIAKTTLLEEP